MLQAASPRLILASRSPSRAALLRGAGLSFDVAPSDLDETALKHQAIEGGNTAGEAALALAGAKATLVAGAEADAVVVGCDQILVCDDVWFDKPATLNAARQHLSALGGRWHTLQTACVCMHGGKEVWRHLEAPSLCMRPLSDRFIDLYLEAEGEAVLASVGAYRLEGLGIQLFSAVQGEYSAILGLPLPPFLGFLRECGILAA